MKFFSTRLLSLVLLILYFPICYAEEFSCDTTKKFKDGSASGENAKLTIQEGKVIGLYVETFNVSGKEGGGYSCTLDTSLADIQSTWSTNGAATTLSVVSYDNQSIIKIEKKGTTFVIDMSETSRYYCGFGAAWPVSITIEKGKKGCKVARH